jgi:hypothetical protein
MAENPHQPERKKKKAVSELALSKRLSRFQDADIIDQYATRYAKDPNLEVFGRISFADITFFAIKWKETSEYHERFNYIWREINTPAHGHDTGGVANGK